MKGRAIKRFYDLLTMEKHLSHLLHLQALKTLVGRGASWGKEYEIWQVLVRQFALGMLSPALIPSFAPLWDVVYPRPVNMSIPLPGGQPF